MELKEFCERIRLPEEAKNMVLSMGIQEEEFCTMKKIYQEDDEKFYGLVLEKEDWKSIFLWYYCRFSCETYEEYKKHGIPENIYWDSFQDIRIWCEHCRQEHGVYGIAVYGWFWRFFRLKVFRLGRLEFEIIDDDIFIHIPQGEPLLWSECEKSLETAYQWFGKDREYLCHSWLLYPGLKEVLPKDSNILKFQEHFDVIKTDFNEREAEWRIFGRVLRVVTDYPENTRLQKRTKEYLLSGKILGNGWGRLMKNL